MVESRILDAVDAKDGVERAALAFVGEFDPVNVVGRSARLFGDVEHVLGWDVNELRLRIDETPDQPWTGDAVDLRPFARHPFARRSPDRPVGRKTIVDPIGDPALQVTCINARGAQRRRDALADLMAMNAVNDDVTSAGQFAPPLLHLVRVTVKGR